MKNKNTMRFSIGIILSLSAILFVIVIYLVGIGKLNLSNQASVPTIIPVGGQGYFNGKLIESSGFIRNTNLQAVKNTDCVPEQGYNVCSSWQSSQDSSGEAVANAMVKIQMNTDLKGVKKGSYFVGNVYLPYKMTGDKFYYLENQGSWDNVWTTANCNEDGCQAETIENQGELLIASAGEEYTTCPVFIAWDYDRVDVPDESWAWTWVTGGYGWVSGNNKCINAKSVGCYDNTDCANNNYCDNSGSWQTWSCKAKKCSDGAEKCEGVTSYSCVNYAWLSNGQVNGKCGYVQTTYYRLNKQDGSCSEITIYPNEITSNDYETLKECKSNIKNNTLTYIAIGAISLIILVITIIIIRRKQK